MRSLLGAGALIVTLTLAGSTASASTPVPPRVTVIADSAFTAVTGNEQPLAILTTGFDTNIDIGVCRRLVESSCPSDTGVGPPTLVDAVHALGPAIAPTVVVEVGYNEFVDTFPASIETAITTLLAAGVTRILWVTMAEIRPQYVEMNETLGAVAARHPEVELVDWASLSRAQPSWFEGDGVHLSYDGAVRMAHLLHDALVSALVAPLAVAPTRLPAARVGKPYSAQLGVRGGLAPYRWRVTSGRITNGLRVLTDGRIAGIPRRSGKLVLRLRATDAVAQSAGLTATISIAR